MNIEADRTVCIGAGQCVLSAPHLFEQSEEDGLVVVLAQPGPEEDAAAREAADYCPSGAVRVRTG